MAAAQVPLAANWIRPGEKLAAHEMIVMQFVASALLFPYLLRDARRCLAMIATSAPLLQLAGMLASLPIGQLAAAWTVLAMWLAGLSLWHRVTPNCWRGFAIACASFLTLGGLMLGYLGAEFGGNPPWLRAMPTVGALQILAGGDIFLPFLTHAFFAGIPAVFLTLRRV